MRRDYVKLFRSSLKSWAFQDPEIWRMWCYCLMRANFRDREVTVKTGRGHKTVMLQAGQFIYGRRSAARALGTSASSVYRRMEKLAHRGSLKIEKPDTHFSIVTVCNWQTYQTRSERGRAPKSEKTGPANGPATGPATGHRQECLKERLEDTETTVPSAVDEKTPIPNQEILDAWNSTRGVKLAIKLTASRAKAMRTRLSDPAWRDSWRTALAKFPLPCFSSVGDWMPNLDWFLKPDTVNNILEGKYDWSKNQSAKPNHTNDLARVREREFDEADIESRTFRSAPVAAHSASSAHTTKPTAIANAR